MLIAASTVPATCDCRATYSLVAILYNKDMQLLLLMHDKHTKLNKMIITNFEVHNHVHTNYMFS